MRGEGLAALCEVRDAAGTGERARGARDTPGAGTADAGAAEADADADAAREAAGEASGLDGRHRHRLPALPSGQDPGTRGRSRRLRPTAEESLTRSSAVEQRRDLALEV